MVLLMTTMWCMQSCGLNLLVDYFNVETRYIREGNVTTRREIFIENVCFLGFWDTRDEMALKEGDIVEVRLCML